MHLGLLRNTDLKGTCLRVYKVYGANPFSLGRFRVGKAGSPEKKTGRFSDELVEACAEMVRNAGIRILNPPGYAAFLH